MIFALALLLATPVEAAPIDCSAPAALAAPWRGWGQKGKARAGMQAEGAPVLPLAKALDATLTPAAQLRFATPPVKGGKDGNGGMFALSLQKPARVGIALSGPAWIDIVDGTTSLTSVDHGHGPQCSGIRKIVWFDLSAGTHIVQIAGSAAPTIGVMATTRTD